MDYLCIRTASSAPLAAAARLVSGLKQRAAALNLWAQHVTGGDR
jgi:hypothetical protein